MRGSGQEAPTRATAAKNAADAAFDAKRSAQLARLRWGLRAGGAAIAFACVASLSIAYVADIGWRFHVLNGLLFLAMLALAYSFAATSRRKHVEQEQRYRAQLFIRTVELQDMAMRDELTQLFNRRYFFERLDREVDAARASQGHLAVVLLDVDKLKGINDTFGHHVGDMVLANLARALVKCTRTDDVPGRLGGDEFGVIMPETSKQGALALGERIQQVLEASPVYEEGGRSIKLSVSIGISVFPGGGESADDMVRWADTCMYAAKTAGDLGTDIEQPAPSRSGPRA